jgi:broad specificity phosphatase PhoE
MRGPASPNTACRILLIRHAVAEGNGRFQGHTDLPLALEARQQLRMLVRKLSPYPVDIVYSSDLERAHATAKAVARRLDVEVVVRSGLREMHFGSWEGLSWRQIARRFPRLSSAWLARCPHQPIPGAERFERFKERVKREMEDIMSANTGRCVGIVTHGGVVRLMLARALGVSDRRILRVAVDAASVSVLDYSGNGTIVRLINHSRSNHTGSSSIKGTRA